jgi:hypothetical protein
MNMIRKEFYWIFGLNVINFPFMTILLLDFFRNWRYIQNQNFYWGVA